jgi:hypothetical protein
MVEEVTKDISNINNILHSSSNSHTKGSSTIKVNSTDKALMDKGHHLRRTLRASNMAAIRMKRVMGRPISQEWDSSPQVKVTPASNIHRDQQDQQGHMVRQEASKTAV